MANHRYSAFRDQMHGLLATPERRERAQALTEKYWHTNYTGPHFDRLADAGHPNEITERDIVAVSMLSVDIPPRVSIWLLSDEGRSEVSARLALVPPNADFRWHGHLLDSGGALHELWDLIGVASWPESATANGMGTTKTSKVLAAKRPALVPIYDSVIRTLLGRVDNYWDAYRYALDEDGLALWAQATAKAPEEVPLLRRIDALLWMFGTEGPEPGE
jgi:hypothetical protein